MAKKKSVTSRLGLIAAFVAASYVLGLIKLPAQVGSVAFDSSPGYFLSAYLDPWIGGIVGALGHLASAASAGFPLGYVHLVVSFLMFFCVAVFGLIARAINKHWGLALAGLAAVFLNGVLLPLIVGFLGLAPMTIAYGIIPLLSVATLLNLIVATVGIILLARKPARSE